MAHHNWSKFLYGLGHVHSHVGHPVLRQRQQDRDKLAANGVNGGRLRQGLDAEEWCKSVKVVRVGVECDKAGNSVTTGPLSAKNL